jgi:hypothetical protein
MSISLRLTIRNSLIQEPMNSILNQQVLIRKQVLDTGNNFYIVIGGDIMKIDINITKEKCLEILKANNYKLEDVKLYYKLNENPYKSNEMDANGLKCIISSIAYENGKEPDFLKSEYPMLDDAEDYLFDKVINRLVNEMLIDSILSKFNKIERP